MVNYILDVSYIESCITIKILVGDDIIMTKKLYADIYSNHVKFNGQLHHINTFIDFIDAMKENENIRYYFCPNDYIEYNCFTEIFSFCSNNNNINTRTDIYMAFDRKEQFIEQLERINAFVRSRIPAI